MGPDLNSNKKSGRTFSNLAAFYYSLLRGLKSYTALVYNSETWFQLITFQIAPK